MAIFQLFKELLFNRINLFFLLIMTFLFIVLYIRKSLTPLKNLIKEAREIDEKLKIKANKLHPMQLKNIDETSKALTSDSNIISKKWMMYINHIGEVLASHDNKEVKLPDFANFLDSDSIISNLNHRWMSTSFPGIFTGLGILGTFLGLVLGVYGLDMANLTGIQNLLANISVAFLTSILGVVFSLATILIDNTHLNNATTLLNSICDSLYTLLPIRNESNVLEAILEKQDTMINSMNEMITDKLLGGLQTSITQSITSVVQPSMEEMINVAKEISNISADVQIEGVHKITSDVVGMLNESILSYLESFTKSLEESKVWMKEYTENAKELTTTLSNETLRYQQFDEASQSLLTSVNLIFNSLSDKITALEKQNTSVNNSIENFAISLELNTLSLESIQESIKTLLEQINLSNSSSKETAMEYRALTAQLETLLPQLNESTVKNITDLHEASQVMKLTAQSITEWKDNLSLLYSDQIEQFQDTVNHFKIFSENTTETFKVIENINQDISNNNIQHLSSLDKVMERLETVSINIEGTNQEIRESIENLELQQNAMYTQTNEYTNNTLDVFERIKENLNNTAAQLYQAASAFSASSRNELQQTFGEFDTFLSEVTTRLSSTITGLQRTLEEVEEITERIPNTFNLLAERITLLDEDKEEIKLALRKLNQAVNKNYTNNQHQEFARIK